MDLEAQAVSFAMLTDVSMVIAVLREVRHYSHNHQSRQTVQVELHQLVFMTSGIN